MSEPMSPKPGSGAAGTPATDLTVLLENYRHNAVLVLASHLCVGSQCSSCGQHWPCSAACAAELALEL